MLSVLDCRENYLLAPGKEIILLSVSYTPNSTNYSSALGG
jgi:hypothetical protein